MKRTIPLFGALLALLIALAGCGVGAADPGTVKVGVVVSLTGVSAPFGNQQKMALELAARDIAASGALGDKKIVFDVEDDHSEVAQAVSIYQKMINSERVAAIIGPTSSTAAKTTSHIAQAAGVPVLLVSSSASSGITDVGDHIFRDSLTDVQLVPPAVDAAHQRLNVRRGVLLYAGDDASTQSSANAFEASMRASGIQVLAKLPFASADKDFGALLTQARDLRPDALFVAAVPQSGVPLLQQARQLGLTMPVIGGNGFNSPQFISGAGPAADNVVLAAAWNGKSDDPASRAFVAGFRAAYRAEPDQFSAQAYAGGTILADAVRRGGTDRAGVLAGLRATANLPTVLGPFTFTPGRDGDYRAVPVRIDGGTYQPLG